MGNHCYVGEKNNNGNNKRIRRKERKITVLCPSNPGEVYPTGRQRQMGPSPWISALLPSICRSWRGQSLGRWREKQKLHVAEKAKGA